MATNKVKVQMPPVHEIPMRALGSLSFDDVVRVVQCAECHALIVQGHYVNHIEWHNNQ
jgi:hypothetical protein